MALSAWEDLSAHIPFAIAWFSDLIFFLYGVPILLAISAGKEEQKTTLFFWMDGVQAVLTAYLTYIAIFTVLPFAAKTLQPISNSTLALTYNIENLVLACAATLRLLSQPRAAERRFYQILCGFLWAYALCAGTYNQIAIITQETSMSDLLVDVPFLLLAVIAGTDLNGAEDDRAVGHKGQLVRFMSSASPVFYTVALVTLGIYVIHKSFTAGVLGICTALSVYAIRTIMLQSQYAESQERLQGARDRLEALSLEDGLTKVANRRYFDRMLDVEWNRAVRTQDSVSLILIDIDHFKTLNDREGHPTGDRCLIEVAHAMQSTLPRSGDHLARYGGEEFAVILPAVNQTGAVLVAEKMRDAVRSLAIRNAVGDRTILTISLGIAVCEWPEMSSPQILIETADRMLYQAKERGRDRIETASIEVAISDNEAQGSHRFKRSS